MLGSYNMYGGTQQIIRKVFGGQRYTFVDFNNEEKFRKSFKTNTKLVWRPELNRA